MMQTPPEDETPKDLRFLKLLVTTLAGVMILGVVVVAATLVIRLSASPAAPLSLPGHIALPEGVTLAAVTLARDWVVVVSGAGEILLYDRATGGLISRVMPD